jgi:hypothetical protein
VLADLGLIEITIDELGQLRCWPTDLDEGAAVDAATEGLRQAGR